jgi:hypothetical protein
MIPRRPGYRFDSLPTLFGEPEERVVKASTETIRQVLQQPAQVDLCRSCDEPKVHRLGKHTLGL